MCQLWAYIDPGTGSMVLQIVLAAVLTAGVAFRRVLFAPLAMLFGRRERSCENETERQPLEK